jgi:hypothetical protein
MEPELTPSTAGRCALNEPARVLVEAVEAAGFGWGDVVVAAFGDVQVAGVFEGRGGGAPRWTTARGPGGPGPARWRRVGPFPYERLIWSANLRQAAGVNRRTGPRPCCFVSRTAMTRVVWPTSMHDAPPLLL